ncbi:hypothetical protein WA1_40850 [Scytonema hofmannii PCC 7110]|uniref:Uncharacterized protein n=1 Tax=Scytonema hofmannii PCC 7110 TaxID=128403 RepID=A0A139WUI2_9CYAN|nr:hypothetical protein [Scytonema hofmannii]KYC36091.1 hypothetical protein WA1_40850 [Scytonema hofmannii PCC 7110]
MANEFLTKKDLLKLTKVIIDLVKVSTKQRIDLFDEGLINNNQNAFIFNEEVKLLNEANKAANQAIEEIATDLKKGEAAKVLEKTITDLQAVINELKRFDTFIGIFAKLISVFSRISQVIAAGGGAVAVISSLVNELIELANPVESQGVEDSDFIAGTI